MMVIKTESLKQNLREVATDILTKYPTDESLVVITEQEYIRLEKLRKKSLAEMKKTVEEIRTESISNGTSDMTLEEIDEIILQG